MRNALAVLRIRLHLLPLALSGDLSFLPDSAVNLRTSWTLGGVTHTGPQTAQILLICTVCGGCMRPYLVLCAVVLTDLASSDAARLFRS